MDPEEDWTVNLHLWLNEQCKVAGSQSMALKHLRGFHDDLLDIAYCQTSMQYLREAVQTICSLLSACRIAGNCLQVPGGYQDSLSKNTKLGRAVDDACSELSHLGELVSAYFQEHFAFFYVSNSNLKTDLASMLPSADTCECVGKGLLDEGQRITEKARL